MATMECLSIGQADMIELNTKEAVSMQDIPYQEGLGSSSVGRLESAKIGLGLVL
jgi:hypothetical protein